MFYKIILSYIVSIFFWAFMNMSFGFPADIRPYILATPPVVYFCYQGIQWARWKRKQKKPARQEAFAGTSPTIQTRPTAPEPAKEGETPASKDTFDSIAGYAEVKASLKFIVKGLADEKTRRLIPRGLLLYGPPGTGKTLFARAIAGEAGVPFSYASGSEFCNKLVGQGAANVRALYEEARKSPVSVVFIDEIDAIGRSREDSDNQEVRATLNQLLTELDGFKKDGPFVLTIAATNDYDHLDKALIRSGRFDRQVCIPNPKCADREKILKLHSKDLKLSDEVGLHTLAATTTGFSGADLASIMREAAIAALTRDSEVINNADIDLAVMRTMTKGEPYRIEDSGERRIIAIHEAAHAVAGKILLGQVISRCTILGSTSGLTGFTLRADPEGSENRPKNARELQKEIIILYAGRAAEKILCNREANVGSKSDVDKATDLIKDYVSKYGFGSSPINSEAFQGETYNTAEEAKRFANVLYQQAEGFVRGQSGLIYDVAELLIKRETITDKDITALVGSGQKLEVVTSSVF